MSHVRSPHLTGAEVLVAAVRNGRQIALAAAVGADIVTAAYAVYQESFAHDAYAQAGAGDKIAFDITPGLAHKYTPAQFQRMVEFFKRDL